MDRIFDGAVLIETIKKKLGIAEMVQVRVRTGPLIKGWTSKQIKFPNVCLNCLKSAKDKWEVTTILVQTKKVVGEEKKEKTGTLNFEVPICEECSKKKKKHSRSISVQTSLLLLFLVLFYAGQIMTPIMELGFEYIAFIPLGLPLILVVLYIIDKRTRELVAISEITLGRDNQRLLRRMINIRNKRDAFVGTKLDPESQTSVVFSFRNPEYASLFKNKNKAILA